VLPSIPGEVPRVEVPQHGLYLEEFKIEIMSRPVAVPAGGPEISVPTVGLPSVTK
jgi:hypothetical protein